MKPKPKGLLSRIAENLVDALEAPKEERLASYVDRIDVEFARLRQQFDFEKTAAILGISDSDRPRVAERVYRRFLDRSWNDSALSPREAELLSWVARTLGLSAKTVSELNKQAAGQVFKTSLSKAIADGRVSEDESKRLQAISVYAGQSVGDLTAQFFEWEGHALLRNIFSQVTADGQLDRQEWNDFQQTVQRLGISREQMLQAIRQPAQLLVEHVLADARSDGEISDREEKVLAGLLGAVIDDVAFAGYVREQIEESKQMQRLAKGLLPSLPSPPGVALRSGEIVHWAGPTRYSRTRELASGTKAVELDGDAVITDARMIFNASEKSFEVNHRKVLAHFSFGDEMEIRAANKGAGRYAFDEHGERAVAIWNVAIGRANQTIVASDDSQTRRHISREIRQRVWQRYGGRCAECSASTYLEFDHIIPVAKGGGNSETNVQLLCRRCNLAKSDKI